MTPDRVLPLLETHFGKWQPAGVNRVAEPAPALQSAARQLMLIDMPDAPQSRILVGGVGGSNSYADFFPIQVLTTIVRGRLSPDRNATLRDYTAGVRSGADMRKAATPFVVAAAAQVDNTAESLKALLDELSGMVKGIPADELARAKDDIALQFPKTFERRDAFRVDCGRWNRSSSTACRTTTTPTTRLRFRRSARATSSVWRSNTSHPDHLTIVIVGDRKTIEPSVRALNLGSIKPMSIDEVFAPAR